MGYWLKSFNKKTNPPVPGTTFTVAQINNRMYFPSSIWSCCLVAEADVVVPLPTTGIFVGMALTWAWISDGVLRGKRWPFIYLGAAINLVFCVLLRQMPLYSNIEGRKIVYWLSNIGVSGLDYKSPDKGDQRAANTISGSLVPVLLS